MESKIIVQRINSSFWIVCDCSLSVELKIQRIRPIKMVPLVTAKIAQLYPFGPEIEQKRAAP